MASPPAAFVLDNEAVQAALDEHHPKHQALLEIIEVQNMRAAKGHRAVVVVPVAARIEAGWDRTDPKTANASRVTRAKDHTLDTTAANEATALRRKPDVQVVDATVAQAAMAAPKPVVIVTSDTKHMKKLAAQITGEVRVKRI